MKKTVVISFCAILLCIAIALFNRCSGPAKQNEKSRIEKFNIGRYLFYDRRLSVNNTRSCATCHNPEFAFTDGYKRSLGVYADLHQRNTQPLFNLSYLKFFTAADSSFKTTLLQMQNPLYNEHPVEMGVKGNEEMILKRISDDKHYRQYFSSIGKEISITNIKNLINEFILSIESKNSLFDRYKNGDTKALNEAQKKGYALFVSDRLNCMSCHGGFNFSSPSITNSRGDTLFYFNTGLYNTNGKGAYPAYDQGLFEKTGNLQDMGNYRVPTLRNLTFTAPYFHDGSAATLEEVLDVYAGGGRNITKGVYKGNGQLNPYKHPAISGFVISPSDKKNLIAFLLSLTDSALTVNPVYQNPFAEDETKKN